MTTRTYIFAGGGTGGHLFPGIAVAQELQRRETDSRILFVGSERDLERTILTRYQFEHRSLPVESLRTLTRNPFRFVLGNWHAWRTAYRMIETEKPAAVIGLGGYASAPIVWAAARSRIPVILLEQNVIPGRTTRWLSRSAVRVCVSFPESASRLPQSANIQCHRQSLRHEIANMHAHLSATGEKEPFELLVLGGSQGADSLNEAVVEAIKLSSKELPRWRIVHQTGPRQTDAIRDAYRQLSLTAAVESFFDDMAARYRAASLVISRAGATTLAELACCGLPMLLVPYPQAADDHQQANALSYQSSGAAVVVGHQSNSHETGVKLATALQSLLIDTCSPRWYVQRRFEIGKAQRCRRRGGCDSI